MLKLNELQQHIITGIRREDGHVTGVETTRGFIGAPRVGVVVAGHATMLFYMTQEGQEGRNAYLERRAPEFDKDGYKP